MEGYKQHLCGWISGECHSVEDVYNFIKDDRRFTYTTNENGLHSYYTGSYYHPSIIYKEQDWVAMFWLFDGDIKDCTHPFHISLYREQLARIMYCSSERIVNNLSISISYHHGKCYEAEYNQYMKKFKYIPILNNSVYKQGVDEDSSYDNNLFTPESYPLCDEMVEFKFKFAD